MRATVIGAGLAGCEAAYQLAKRGITVTLREMKPRKMSPAHTSEYFAELVCSNSLRGAGLENAVGLLKEELRRLDSVILRAADATRVEAGGALAVDRYGFSKYVTEAIRNHPNITVVEGEAAELPEGQDHPQPPQGGPDQFPAGEAEEASTDFILTGSARSFSGIAGQG